jgi:hypothetical protein
MADIPAIPATPTATDQAVGLIKALAADAGMTTQQFMFGGLAELIGPFEKQLADRIYDGVMAKFTTTAEIGKPNDALQADFNKPLVP